MCSSSWRLLNQSAHSKVVNSTSSRVFQGAFFLVTSVL